MNDTKNNNIDEVVESEEVLEVALAEDGADDSGEDTASDSVSSEKEASGDEKPSAPTAAKEENKFEYTDGEMSGLTPKQRRRKEIFDKITTGILIALMSMPFLIVLYIFLWFILR